MWLHIRYKSYLRTLKKLEMSKCRVWRCKI